eukprot:74798-Rhodomonas_salina.3
MSGGSIVLWLCYAVSGTKVRPVSGYQSMRCPVLQHAVLLPDITEPRRSTDVSDVCLVLTSRRWCYQATKCSQLESHLHSLSLQVCYAMSGTDLAYAATSHSKMSASVHAIGGLLYLRARMVLCGSDICIGASYAVPGTDRAYGATSSMTRGPRTLALCRY